MINGRGTFDAREAERLALLEYLDAAHPEADSVLQGLVDDARSAFGTDLALINLILPEEYTESRLGREHSLCARVVAKGEPLVVEDFLADEEYRDQYFSVNHGTCLYAPVGRRA